MTGAQTPGNIPCPAEAGYSRCGEPEMAGATHRPQDRRQSQSPISIALAANGRALLTLGLVSGIINILMLTGAVFMIQIYDRVLTSNSLPTLIALSAMAVAAYVLQGGLDAVRARVLSLIGERIDARIGPNLYTAVVDLPLRSARPGHETLQPFRDLEAVRSFMSGPGPIAFFDMPWLPVYLMICYLFHPLLGYAATLAAILLLGITALTDLRGSGPTRRALEAQSRRNLLADTGQRGAEVIRAMGMMPALAERWREMHIQHLAAQRSANFIIGGLSSLARTSRMVVQSCMLGLGAYLAIEGEISGGTIIAVSILASRALAPVDQAIGSWRGFVAARQGYGRLRQLLASFGEESGAFELPPPCKTLAAEALFVGPPGASKPIVRNIGFRLEAGQSLGIIGASASGKSTLARALVGVWTPLSGKVMLDCADLRHWPAGRLGPHIGYLPQEIQLFDGSIADNIARFQRPLDSEAAFAAARAAGFHEQILGLPNGFETYIGLGGIELSAGQKQRLGLARALYGDPFLVVLDEPNSNLDAEGERALKAAIAGVGARGGIAVVIAHRTSIVAAVSLVAVMRGGEIIAIGPREEILARPVSLVGATPGRNAAIVERLRTVEPADPKI
jgi:ATP-binding cassette subfamily C protein PrsD